MKLLILCREPRLYSCQRLKTAAEQRGFEIDILDPNRFLLRLEQGKLTAYYQEGEHYEKNRPAPQPLPHYTAVIGRFGTASTEMGCKVLNHYELQGVPVLNTAHSFRVARDKWQSLQTLVAVGLPVPESALAGELCHTPTLCQGFSYPIIIKTLMGSQGVGVMLSENRSSALSMLDTLRNAKIETLTQQFIADSAGEDIRAFVIGNEVVAAMSRVGRKGEFRANIHQGGSAFKIELSETEKQRAIQAAQTIGLAVAGVDLIRSKAQTFILEVNASPSLEMIENVCKEDIAGKMLDYLQNVVQI